MRASRQQPEAPGLPGAAARPQAPRKGKGTVNSICLCERCLCERCLCERPRRAEHEVTAPGPARGCRARPVLPSPAFSPRGPGSCRPARSLHSGPSQATAIRRLPRSPSPRPPCPRAASRPPTAPGPCPPPRPSPRAGPGAARRPRAPPPPRPGRPGPPRTHGPARRSGLFVPRRSSERADNGDRPEPVTHFREPSGTPT